MSQQRSLIAIFFLIATLIWTVHCPSQKNNFVADMQFGYALFCETSYRPTTTDFPLKHDYQDMNDGTIKWHVTQPNYDPGLRSLCGDRAVNEVRYFKKCLQGQVYRPLPDNDCQGAGSAGDNWGVQTFQYCPTNDRACEMYVEKTTAGYAADPAISPAAISCAGDTTAGRSWALIRFLEYGSPVFPPDIRPYAPEFPLGVLSIVWYDTPFNTGSTQYFYADAAGAAQYSNSQNKDQPGFVLCMSR